VPTLRDVEMKVLAASLIAAAVALLSVVAFELVDIRRTLRGIERDDRQLVVVIHQDLKSGRPAAKPVKVQTGDSPRLAARPRLLKRTFHDLFSTSSVG